MKMQAINALCLQQRDALLAGARMKINNNVCWSVTGKLYAVFGKRQGRVISADSAHGFGGHFRVLAVLPVQESFHLARELRTQTSGLASPQLVFSHWEVSRRLRHVPDLDLLLVLGNFPQVEYSFRGISQVYASDIRISSTRAFSACHLSHLTLQSVYMVSHRVHKSRKFYGFVRVGKLEKAILKFYRLSYITDNRAGSLLGAVYGRGVSSFR